MSNDREYEADAFMRKVRGKSADDKSARFAEARGKPTPFDVRLSKSLYQLCVEVQKFSDEGLYDSLPLSPQLAAVKDIARRVDKERAPERDEARAEVERLRAEVERLRAEVERLRAEVERLRAELAKTEEDAARWRRFDSSVNPPADPITFDHCSKCETPYTCAEDGNCMKGVR